MQKIMICIARPKEELQATWNIAAASLFTSLSETHTNCSYTIADSDVAPAHLLEMNNTAHPKDAVVSLWVDHAYDLESIYLKVANLGLFQAYAVMESEPLNRERSLGRVDGMCQVALIKTPASMLKQDWLDIWLGDHTRIAIDTQSTFGYRQNVVVTPLPLATSNKPEWPLVDAIVEENFPAIAMTDRHVFFDSAGNPEQFEERQQAMMQSCFRFIDFEAFDCVPMSEYLL
jgi:hypothetical protein